MVAAKMANLKPGEKLVSALKKSAAVSYDRAQAPVTTAMAAETLNVGTATVSRAKQVLKSGDQDLIDADMTSTAGVQRWYRHGLLPDVLDIGRPIFRGFPY